MLQVKGLQCSSGAVQKLGLKDAFQQVVRQEGVRALWKGNGVTMLHRLPYSAVNFWAYEQFTQIWQQHFPPAANHSQDAVLRRLVAGGAAGMSACTLVNAFLIACQLACITVRHKHHDTCMSRKRHQLTKSSSHIFDFSRKAKQE